MHMGNGGLMYPKVVKPEHSASTRAVAVLAALILSVALYAFVSQSRHPFSLGLEHGADGSILPGPGHIGDTNTGGMHLIPPPSTSPEELCTENSMRLAITGSTNEPLHRILQWIRYHQLVGFSLFYLFVEGHAEDAAVVDVLRSLVGVKVFLRDDKLAWWHKRSRAHHENWLAKFFGQPCNGELFVKQSLNMEVAIQQALVDGASWIGHIDTDELVYPSGSASYSMHEILQHVPHGAHALVLPNYEALPEHDRVVNPALEVSLFKMAVDHIDKNTMQQNYKHIAHGNPNYFIAYSNGKSLARVEPGLRPHGAHRWASYNGTFQAFTHEQAAILHYTYNRVSELISRRDRCECAPTEVDVKRCFWLQFDQQAFVAAALKTDEQLRVMFNERMVWNDPEMVAQMRMRGLVQRIYAPQMLIRQFPENVGEAVPWRSIEKRAEDEAVRAATVHSRRFSYAPHGLLDACESFLREDSSLNVLEMMGPVPGPEDVRDSDKVLHDRMRQHREMQRSIAAASSQGTPSVQQSRRLSRS